jgi:tetratricopeptide (TPR) repeat protein
MENITKIDSKVSIILKITKQNSAQSESFFAQIAKSKTELECIVIINNNDQNLIDNNKSFAELVSKNKGKIIANNNTLGNGYAMALKQASGTVSLLISDITSVNLNSIISWVNTNKKNILMNEIHVGSHGLKGSNGKVNATFVAKLYNSALRFFTTLNLRDHSANVLVAKTLSLSAEFDNKLATANTHLDILSLANYSGIHLKEFALSAEKNINNNTFLNVLSVPFLVFMLRFKYFVTSAIAELKYSEKPSLSNGNHPIYRLLFFVLILLSTIAMPYLSKDFGMTWDEKQHNDYSLLSSNWMLTMGADSSAIIDATGNADFIRQCYRYYGEQSNLIAALVYRTFNLAPFETRHFIISLYGLLGLIGIALAAKELAGWRAGILAILFTFFNPGWLGNSMNNPTDIPFAAGFALSLYFIIKILKALPKPKFSHLVWLGIAIGIGIGGRIGAFLLIAYFGLFMGVNWLSLFKNKNSSNSNIKLIWPYAKIVIAVACFGYLFGILLWPYALESPFKNPFIAFSKASDNVSFYTNNVELFDGKRLYMRDQAPWYYVIKFLTMGNPIYLLLGFALGIVLIKWINTKINFGYLGLLLFMIVFPIAYAEYANLNYYNGWRHYLFILPSLITLSAVVFDFLLGQNNKIIRIVTAITVLGLFAKPTYWIIKNHPNEYVYFNELVGGIDGAYGNFETDYYSNSCREAGEWIAKQHPNEKLLVCINNEPLTASYYANKINPNLQFQWVREYEEQKPNWDYLIVTSRTYSKNELLNGSFPPKGTVYTVMADNVPLAAVVKREVSYMPLGYKAIDEQKYDTALYYFKKAVEWEPTSEEAHRMYGFACMVSNNFDKAIKQFDEAIKIFPENYSAYSSKGLLYFNKKEYQKCIDACVKATTYKNNVTEAYYYSALAYLNMNNYDGAIDRLETALKFNGQSPEIFYYLGKSYEAVKNTTKAISNFENCLGMNPKFKQAWLDLANQYRSLGKSQQEIDYCMQQYNSLP